MATTTAVNAAYPQPRRRRIRGSSRTTTRQASAADSSFSWPRLLLARIRRRFGWGYAAFTAVVVAIPFVTTKDFFGSGRYMLAAFPAFAAAADFLAERPPWVLRTVLVLFAVGLAYGMVLYTRGYEVS